MQRFVRAIIRSLWMVAATSLAATGQAGEIVTWEDLGPGPKQYFKGGVLNGHYWNGPAANAVAQPGPYGGVDWIGSVTTGGVEFSNRNNDLYGTWSGFAWSNTTDTMTPGYLNQYSAFTGSGAGPGMDNYGVVFGNADLLDPGDVSQLAGLPHLTLPEGASIESAYVTNATYAALSMLQGESFAKKFGGPSGNDPDWFKLSAYGTDALGNPLGEVVEFFLADYRFSDNTQDYVVDDWMLLDLSALADARRIYFNLTSSDVGLFGMNTPAYFAIDNIAYSTGLTDPDGGDPATRVPEPASWALFALCGAMGGLSWGRSSRRTSSPILR